MNKILLIIALIVVVVGGYFILKGSIKSSTPASVQTFAANTVSIKNFAFNPGTLTVKAGTTVTWTNEDQVSHQIKSDMFNSNLLKQGNSFQFTFAQKGSYQYSCAIHPFMKGRIVVE